MIKVNSSRSSSTLCDMLTMKKVRMLHVQERSSIVIVKPHTTYWYVIYFADNCIYNDDSFKRRFRLNNAMFLHISNALEVCHDFFKQKSDAKGRMSFLVYKNVRLRLGIWIRYSIRCIQRLLKGI